MASISTVEKPAETSSHPVSATFCESNKSNESKLQFAVSTCGLNGSPSPSFLKRPGEHVESIQKPCFLSAFPCVNPCANPVDLMVFPQIPCKNPQKSWSRRFLIFSRFHGPIKNPKIFPGFAKPSLPRVSPCVPSSHGSPPPFTFRPGRTAAAAVGKPPGRCRCSVWDQTSDENKAWLINPHKSPWL